MTPRRTPQPTLLFPRERTVPPEAFALSTLERRRAESRDDDRLLRRTLIVAGVLHLLLLLLRLPVADAKVELVAADRPPVVRLTEFRFREREPTVAPPVAVERQVPRRPVPEPEPAAPEPVREVVLPAPPPLEIGPVDLALEVPTAPPPISTAPRVVAGEVLAPVRSYDPAPPYPERARRAGREGVAIVQATIDAEGGVADVRVLRDPGLGLGDSAARTIRTWRFEPATYRGEPVAVYYNLTVNFTIHR